MLVHPLPAWLLCICMNICAQFAAAIYSHAQVPPLPGQVLMERHALKHHVEITVRTCAEVRALRARLLCARVYVCVQAAAMCVLACARALLACMTLHA